MNEIGSNKKKFRDSFGIDTSLVYTNYAEGINNKLKVMLKKQYNI